MARFSQGLLTGLGQPAMLQDFRLMGAALGNVPSQYRAKKTREANAEAVSRLQKNSPEYYEELARQAEVAGDMGSAAKFVAAAQKIRSSLENKESQVRQQRVLAKSVISDLQGYLKRPDITEAERERALGLLRSAAVAGDDAIALEGRVAELASSGDSYGHLKVVGNRVFDMRTETFISPKDAAEALPINALKEIATPESIVKYLKSNNPNDLDAISANGGGGSLSSLQQTDNVLRTLNKAHNISEDYWAATYDVGKFIPLSDARELNTYVTTLKSNLAFDRLKRMRQESKTGGALGQVSNIELGLLESSVAALDPAAPNFREQLDNVREQYLNFRAALLGQDPPSDKYKRASDGNLYYMDEDGDWNQVPNS